MQTFLQALQTRKLHRRNSIFRLCPDICPLPKIHSHKEVVVLQSQRLFYS